MLNHVWTLLMNIPGGGDTDYIAAELVDPGYVPVVLPTPLARVRSVLFGETPDREMLAYRCRQLLTIAWATPLRDRLLEFDNRVTFEYEDPVPSMSFSPALSTVPGGRLDGISVAGVATPPDSSGKMRGSYGIETTGGGNVRVTDYCTPFQITLLEFDGNPILLGDTGLSIRLQNGAGGQHYFVEFLRKPTRDVSSLLASVGSLGESTLRDLFVSGTAEPDQSCRLIWSRSRELPLRTAALVLALARRTEEVRSGG